MLKEGIEKFLKDVHQGDNILIFSPKEYTGEVIDIDKELKSVTLANYDEPFFLKEIMGYGMRNMSGPRGI